MPSDPGLKLRVSLELWGPGEVWIDDVRIYDKWFEPAEQNQLLKILQVAFTQQRGNQWGECYQTLSGYWPRFLLRHVPHVEQQVTRLPLNQPPVPPPPPSMWDRLKSVVPSFRF